MKGELSSTTTAVNGAATTQQLTDFRTTTETEMGLLKDGVGKAAAADPVADFRKSDDPILLSVFGACRFRAAFVPLMPSVASVLLMIRSTREATRYLICFWHTPDLHAELYVNYSPLNYLVNVVTLS